MSEGIQAADPYTVTDDFVQNTTEMNSAAHQAAARQESARGQPCSTESSVGMSSALDGGIGSLQK